MPGRTSRSSASWLGCALALAAPPAFADPSGNLSVVLEYQADPTLTGCPSAAELSQVIRERLGYDPFVAAAPNHVKATIERATTGAAAHVEWRDAQGQSEGERQLSSESGDCAELGRGLAFAIAVQLQLRASSEPAPPKPPEPQPTATPPARPPATPRSRRSTIVTAGAGVLTQYGLTPRLSPGARIFGALGSSRFSVELSTEATLPTTWSAPDGSGFSARTLDGKLAPCAHVSFAGLCGLGMLGLLSVRGQGLDRIQSPASLVGALGARLQLQLPSDSSVAALAHIEALISLTPRTILVNREAVWSTAPVFFSAGVDLAAVFR